MLMTKIITTTFIIVIISIPLLATAKGAAKGLNSLVPETIDGPVTNTDIARFNSYYKNFQIPDNNDNKKITWKLAPFVHSLLFMYEATNDIQYIDYAIKCADHIISVKRKHDTDYPTQKTIPGWGYFNDQFKSCLLYTSPSPRDQRGSRMPSSA